VSKALSTVNQRRIPGFHWPLFLVALVICSLTLSLATRFCNQVVSSTHVAKAMERRALDPKRQHLNRDSMRWAPPVAHIAYLAPVAVPLHVDATEPPAPQEAFSETLYDRPPPSATSL